jgi:hypothetical protein
LMTSFNNLMTTRSQQNSGPPFVLLSSAPPHEPLRAKLQAAVTNCRSQLHTAVFAADAELEAFLDRTSKAGQ